MQGQRKVYKSDYKGFGFGELVVPKRKTPHMIGSVLLLRDGDKLTNDIFFLTGGPCHFLGPRSLASFLVMILKAALSGSHGDGTVRLHHCLQDVTQDCSSGITNLTT